MTFYPASLEHALVAARRTGTLIRFTPDLAPADVARAMSIQAAVAREIGASVAGWKVGYTPDGIPVAAPLYADLVFGNGAKLPVGPSGTSGIEVEIAARLGRDVPPRQGRPYGRDEILESASGLLAGVEIVGNRFLDPKPPFLALLADNIGNSAYVRGADVAAFRQLDLPRLRATLAVDGKTVHDAQGGHSKGDPLVPMIDYASQPCDGLGGLKAGQIVTLGTLNGCPYVGGAHHIRAEIEGLGVVEFDIVGQR